jgi:hypothetical protein
VVWHVADGAFDPTGIGARRAWARPRHVAATLIVMMRSAVFAALATPLTMLRPSLAWITARLREGCRIVPPRLRVRLPPRARAGAWPVAVGHDG